MADTLATLFILHSVRRLPNILLQQATHLDFSQLLFDASHSVILPVLFVCFVRWNRRSHIRNCRNLFCLYLRSHDDPEQQRYKVFLKIYTVIYLLAMQ